VPERRVGSVALNEIHLAPSTIVSPWAGRALRTADQVGYEVLDRPRALHRVSGGLIRLRIRSWEFFRFTFSVRFVSGEAAATRACLCG
jgi:hypothetical protein